MLAEPMKTLFHPFEAEMIALPRKGARVLFLGAIPGFRLPAGFDASLHLIQGFRPYFRALQAAGLATAPQAEGEGYDLALVLAGRHRGESELRIADALARTKPGGLVVVAGSKDDGLGSLRKRIAGMIPLDGQMPKHHGIVFWLHRPADVASLAQALRSGAASRPADGRFHAAPGMFSHERIDPGSRLLVASLPDNLSGRVADFCAGWGYLAWEVARRFPAVKGIDLYEADFASVEAARANLAGIASPPIRCFWHDLAAEPVADRYDAIVMNPPFHTERRAEPELGQTMIRKAMAVLKPGGRLFMVANRQLPYERCLAVAASDFRQIAEDRNFKVISVRR
jgi:16S rRNA (guanine1207-N2)-methyltransferase